MYNTVGVNPAYASSIEDLSIFILHRNQWVGLDGAPVTNNVTITTPIEESNLGLGLSFINDKIGPTIENSISADIAYTVNLSLNYKLSFGLKATANIFNFDSTKLNIRDANDPQFQNLKSDITPNLGSGLYLYSDKTYFGVSVPNFFESKHFDSNQIAITRERLHYYFIAGHVFDLSPSVQFKPALITKVVEGAPLQTDFTGNFLINEKLTLGGSYRYKAAVSGLIAFQISKKLLIGYGYDSETTKLSNYNSGSHEIFIRFNLYTSNKITSPRFF